jgi:hypothetical protein
MKVLKIFGRITRAKMISSSMKMNIKKEGTVIQFLLFYLVGMSRSN